MKLSRTQQGEAGVEFILWILFLIVFLVVDYALGSFVKEKEATEAARIAGFRNVEVVDKAIMFMSWRGCSAEDDARFTVRAVNSQGEKVEFYVCASLFFKGSTIRTK